MAKFHKVTEEEGWVYPKMRGYKMACCDCGLVHNVTTEVFEELSHPFLDGDVKPLTGYKVRWDITRNEPSTRAMRREDKKKGGERYARDLIELRDSLVKAGLWDDVVAYAKGKLNANGR